MFYQIVLILICGLLLSSVAPQDSVDSKVVAEDETLLKNETVVSHTPTPTTGPSTSQSTTSTVEPPSTQMPDKPFPANVGNWSVEYPQTNVSCILFRAALQLQYIDDQDSLVKHYIDVPTTSNSEHGVCGNTTQTLRLQWDHNSENDSKHDANGTLKFTLEIMFAFQPADEKHYAIKQFQLQVAHLNSSTVEANEDNTDLTLDDEGPYFPTPFGKSFVCISRNTISGNFTVRTFDLQFEAFRSKEASQNNFSEVEVCNMDVNTMGTIIGIAVGSVLAILLAIGLGAYVGIRYGYCRFSCCNRAGGYQRIDI